MQTIRRRRITARGTTPVGTIQHRFANCYLYGAVAPATGDGYFLGLPKLTAALFQVFLDEFAKARPHTLNVLLLDNSRCHTAHDLAIPENIILLFQEPYAPELNPIERVWRDLKDDLAWACFADLAALQARLVELVTAYDSATLHSLTAYPYVMDGIYAVCS